MATAKTSMPMRTILICYVGWMFDFYDLALFSFLLTQVGHEFGLTLPQEAWLLGAGLGASGVGGILFGLLADRYGRKRIMGWTILLYSLGTAATAFAPNAAVFFALRIITGLGIGGEWAVGHALVAESVPAKQRGRASAWLQSGEPAGVALAAIMGLLVAPLIGWRAVMLVSGSTALWPFVVRKYLPESTLWKNATHGKTSGSENAAAHAALVRRRAMRWFFSPQGAGLAARALVLAMFKLGTYWTCYIWLPKFFLTRFHEPIGRSFVWILTAQVGQFIGMQIFGRVSDHLGRRPAYTLFSVLTALPLIALATEWQWLLEHRTYFWLTMATLGFGSGCTAGFGALLSELFPTEIRNFGMGACYNLARGMQLFAPVLVAACAARWDILGALGVPAVLALATAAWVWTLPETRGRDLTRIPS